MMQVRSDEGFTLLEVLVATAILAMAFGAIFPIFGSMPGRLQAIEHRAALVAFTTEKLEEELIRRDWVGMPFEREEDGWRWSVDGVPTEDADTSDPDGYPFELTVTARSTEWEAAPLTLSRILWVRGS